MKITHRTARLCIVLCAILAALAESSSHGYTVTFVGLGGADNSVFSSHSEGGFTVTPIAGSWRVGQSFGTPPDIFALPPGEANVRVTDTITGKFTFGGVNLAGLTTSSGTYTIEGFLNNASVLNTAGTLHFPNTFFNVVSPSTTTVLDRLDIRVAANTATSVHVDNIIVSHVPEPGSLMLLLTAGCAVFGIVRRPNRRS